MSDDILAIANDKHALAKHLHEMGADTLERYLTILNEETQKELAQLQAIATAAREVVKNDHQIRSCACNYHGALRKLAAALAALKGGE